MKRIVLIASLTTLLACSGGDNLPPSLTEGKTLASVNGKTINEGLIKFLEKVNPRIKAQTSSPITKQKLIEDLAESELLYQESIKRGLDSKPEVQEKLSMMKRGLITNALLENEVEIKSKEYYEKNKEKEFTKVQISHIQISFKEDEDEEKPAKPEKPKKPLKPGEKPVAEDDKPKKKEPPTEAEKNAAKAKAEAIKKRLDAGEDFAKVAEEVSGDKATKKKGGDLGWISKSDERLKRRGIPELTDIAFTLKKDQVSDIIETSKGYHIIKVVAEPKVSTYEEVSKFISFQVQKKVKEDLIAELKKKGKIEYFAKPAIDKKAEKKEEASEEKKEEGETKEESKKEEPKEEPKE